MPYPCEVYPGICLTTEEKARKNLSQGSRRMPVGMMKTEYTQQSIHNNKNTKTTISIHNLQNQLPASKMNVLWTLNYRLYLYSRLDKDSLRPRQKPPELEKRVPIMRSIETTSYLHICWRLWTCLNRDTGCNSCTLMGPRTGRRCKKNKYRPLRECSTAFSMKSTMVWLLNLVELPKLKLPAIHRQSIQYVNDYNTVILKAGPYKI